MKCEEEKKEEAEETVRLEGRAGNELSLGAVGGEEAGSAYASLGSLRVLKAPASWISPSCKEHLLQRNDED